MSEEIKNHEESSKERPVETAEAKTPFCWKRFCWRGGLICIETGTVVLAVLALVAGILLWRISSSPLDIGFAKGYVEQALKNSETGVYAKMDKLVLHWPDFRGPLLLGLQNARVMAADGHQMISIAEVGLALSKPSLLLGKVAPTSIILRQPRLRVIRTADNRIDVGFGALAGTAPKDQAVRVKEQTHLMTRILEFVAKPGDEKEDTPFATLQAFEIQQAKLVVEDRALGISWDIPRFDAAFASADEGLKSSIVVELPGWEGGTARLTADLNYGWEDKTSNLRARIESLDIAMLASKFPELALLEKQDAEIDVNLEADIDKDFVPQKLAAELISEEGVLNIADLSPEPLSYSDFGALVEYDAQEKVLSLSQARITTKGVTFAAEADLARDEEGVVSGPVTLGIKRLEHAQIDPLWPEFLRGDNAEDWIVHKMSDGVLSNVSASGNLLATPGEEGWAVDMEGVKASFDYEGLTVNYRDPLWPVTQGAGSGYMDVDQDHLLIKVESGLIGDLVVDEAQLEFHQIVEEGKGTADINIKLGGPLSELFLFGEVEPIELSHGFDLAKVEGNAELTVDLHFSKLSDISFDDVKVDIRGVADNVSLPDVVEGLELTGGPYKVDLADGKVIIDGKGQLAGRDIDVRYEDFVNSAGSPFDYKVNAKLLAGPKLREHFGIVLDDFLEGAVRIDVVYTKYSEKRAEAYVNADLTPSLLFIEAFDYQKNQGVKGNARAKVLFENGSLREIQNLTANAPAFTLEEARLIFEGKGKNNELRRGDISRLTIGETIGKVEFEVLPAKGDIPGQMKIAMTGPFFDLRPFLSSDEDRKEEDYNDRPIEVSISADQMRTSNDDTIQYGKLYAAIDHKGRFDQLEFDALAGYKRDDLGNKTEVPAEIYLRFKVDDQGMRTFRLEADNAGATLRAFQIYDNIRGGKLVVYAEPIRGVYDRNLIGVAEITNFKVTQAPGLAKLLGALSLTGVIDLLSNEGVSFSKLEAKFDWLYRPQGGLLILTEGRTSGNSLGLTFDGVVDNPAGSINLSGTLVPISGVNKVLSAIPLIGDILSGGSDSVFAATYKVEGKTKDPQVSVNPLSVLAPGILRRILFE